MGDLTDIIKLLEKRCDNGELERAIPYRYKIGDFLTYQGNEYCVVNRGPWGYRCERGFGRNLSVIVLPLEEFI